MSSCTTALHLALLAVGVKPSDEVITVSHSFIATANAIRYCGAEPIFVDIKPDTFNINPAKIEDYVSNRTKAILCVHQMGMPCELKKIIEIGRNHNIPVIEDAACAIGSAICINNVWQKIGKPHGDIACFSFHPRKVLTTGDGGMITTDNETWDKKFRLLRQHGMSITDTVRHRSPQIIFESYPVVGFNYRMTDIQAAIGRVQLRRLEKIIERRRFLAERYHNLLENVTGLQVPVENAWARSNWQSYCVRLPDWSEQRQVMQKMLDEGIATRRGIMCIHREPAYANDGHNYSGLRESEIAQDRTIVLPLYHQMTEDDQDRVISVLKKSCSDRD